MSDRKSAFLTLVSGLYNHLVKYWPSLTMFMVLVIAGKYLDSWATFMLAIAFWVIHSGIIDDAVV